jgi:hypothetical protein
LHPTSSAFSRIKCRVCAALELRDLEDVRALLESGGDLERALADAPLKDGGFSPTRFGVSRDPSASCRRPSPVASTLRRFVEGVRRLPKPFGNPLRRVADRGSLSAVAEGCDGDGNNRGEAATLVVDPPNVVAMESRAPSTSCDG